MLPSKLNFAYAPYVLKFKEPGGTSRGVLTEKLTYFVKIYDPENPETAGYGEVGFFDGLSSETRMEVKETLRFLTTCHSLEDFSTSSYCSSVTMGVETAILDIENGARSIYFPSDFLNGVASIEINGLIWMGSFDRMRRRIQEKLRDGFRCIKIKIGAIDWEEELDTIRYVRQEGGKDITIRLDANGAFSPEECLEKLSQLSQFDIHSIEQPIRAGQHEEMRRICQHSPIPVALDEELIGIPPGNERQELLEDIKPHYLILKPSLCYGFSGTKDWIERAEKEGIGWWITSALESSLGLDAIAQYTYSLNVKMPQGLGTGNLFTNNLPSPLTLEGDNLKFTGPTGIFREQLKSFQWRET